VRVDFTRGEAAVFVETMDRRLLAAADLHLGYEVELAREGVYLPGQLQNTIERMLALLREWRPDTLLLLGDVKHRVTGVSWRESRQVTELLLALREHVDEIIITPGNHDAGILVLASGQARVTSGRGVSIGEVWAMHGHCWPPPEAAEAKLILMGHTHPSVSFARGPGSRRRVFLHSKTERDLLARLLSEKSGRQSQKRLRGEVGLIVLPHFNNALQGIDISQLSRAGRVSPLLRPEAFDLFSSSIILSGGETLGSVGWYIEAGGIVGSG
jgi:putative SbcD/Mre11-related phosphoesterase